MHEKGSVSMMHESNLVEYVMLGDEAEGTIGGNPETHPRLNEFTNRVGDGEFHSTTDLTIPCGCIDGRCGCVARPNAAGGTLTMAVADDLLVQAFAGDGETKDMVRNVFRFLREQGYPSGGHTDDHASGDKSGCGANDQLEKIYGIISNKADVIRTISGMIGVEPSDETHDAIKMGAARRQHFSTGREVLDVMREEAGEENVDVLRGEHGEVAAVINLRVGTTLDRDAVAVEFGDEYEAFNLDAWSFDAAARALYPDADDDEVDRTVAAMTYYNIATALALCGPTMRVVVLR